MAVGETVHLGLAVVLQGLFSGSAYRQLEVGRWRLRTPANRTPGSYRTGTTGVVATSREVELGQAE